MCRRKGRDTKPKIFIAPQKSGRFYFLDAGSLQFNSLVAGGPLSDHQSSQPEPATGTDQSPVPPDEGRRYHHLRHCAGPVPHQERPAELLLRTLRGLTVGRTPDTQTGRTSER